MEAVDKRARILDAALHLFVERGFHGTAVPLIAERAGVATGTIYRYFADKEALLNELFRHWKLNLGQHLLLAVSGDLPWRRRFHLLWQALYRFSREHPDALEFLELHLHGDALDAESRALEQQMGAALFAFVAAAQAEDAMIDLPAPALVALVYGAFLGLLRADRTGWLALDDALVADAEERAWALVRR